jgi:hypothetical protein
MNRIDGKSGGADVFFGDARLPGGGDHYAHHAVIGVSGFARRLGLGRDARNRAGNVGSRRDLGFSAYADHWDGALDFNSRSDRAGRKKRRGEQSGGERNETDAHENLPRKRYLSLAPGAMLRGHLDENMVRVRKPIVSGGNAGE